MRSNLLSVVLVSLSLAGVGIRVSQCQLRTDEVEPAVMIQPPLVQSMIQPPLVQSMIQPPLVQSMNPSESFNNSERLFENVGLYLFKRRIHIEEFYYTRDNSSAPTEDHADFLKSSVERAKQTPATVASTSSPATVASTSSPATVASTSSPATVASASTMPSPPVPDKSSDMLSLLAKRESGANANDSAVPTTAPVSVTSTQTQQPITQPSSQITQPSSQITQPSASPSTPAPVTSRSTSPFQPFSFSVTSTPMRQPINGDRTPFRLPSILDRFRRPSTAAPASVASFFPTPAVTPSTSVPVITSTTPSTTVQSPLPIPVTQPTLLMQPVIQNPVILQPTPIQSQPIIPQPPPQIIIPQPPPQVIVPQPPPQVIVPQPPSVPLTINGSFISEINALALSRRRFRFKDLSSGEFLNETTPECRRQLRMTDSCLKKILLISTDVPRTEGQLNETYCNNLNSTLKCLGGYSKCLTRVPRIMYNFVYLSLKRQLLEICNSQTVRNQLVLHANCFQNETDRKVLRDVSSRGTLTAVYVLQNVGPSDVIQWGCCGFFKMFEDGKRAIDHLCTRRTGPGTGKWIMDLVMKSAADLLEIGCLRYSSVSSCRIHLPAAIHTFEALTAGDIPDQKFSPVIPLIEISRKLAGEF